MAAPLPLQSPASPWDVAAASAAAAPSSTGDAQQHAQWRPAVVQPQAQHALRAPLSSSAAGSVLPPSSSLISDASMASSALMSLMPMSMPLPQQPQQKLDANHPVLPAMDFFNSFNTGGSIGGFVNNSASVINGSFVNNSAGVSNGSWAPHPRQPSPSRLQQLLLQQQQQQQQSGLMPPVFDMHRSFVRPMPQQMQQQQQQQQQQQINGGVPFSVTGGQLLYSPQARQPSMFMSNNNEFMPLHTPQQQPSPPQHQLQQHPHPYPPSLAPQRQLFGSGATDGSFEQMRMPFPWKSSVDANGRELGPPVDLPPLNPLVNNYSSASASLHQQRLASPHAKYAVGQPSLSRASLAPPQPNSVVSPPSSSTTVPPRETQAALFASPPLRTAPVPQQAFSGSIPNPAFANLPPQTASPITAVKASQATNVTTPLGAAEQSVVVKQSTPVVEATPSHVLALVGLKTADLDVHDDVPISAARSATDDSLTSPAVVQPLTSATPATTWRPASTTPSTISSTPSSDASSLQATDAIIEHANSVLNSTIPDRTQANTAAVAPRGDMGSHTYRFLQRLRNVKELYERHKYNSDTLSKSIDDIQNELLSLTRIHKSRSASKAGKARRPRGRPRIRPRKTSEEDDDTVEAGSNSTNRNDNLEDADDSNNAPTDPGGVKTTAAEPVSPVAYESQFPPEVQERLSKMDDIKKKAQVLRARARALMLGANLGMWLLIKQFNSVRTDVNWDQVLETLLGPVFETQKTKRKSSKSIRSLFIELCDSSFQDNEPNCWDETDWTAQMAWANEAAETLLGRADAGLLTVAA